MNIYNKKASGGYHLGLFGAPISGHFDHFEWPKWPIPMVNSVRHFHSKWFETVQSNSIPNGLKQYNPFPFYPFPFQMYCKLTLILFISILNV